MSRSAYGVSHSPLPKGAQAKSTRALGGSYRDNRDLPVYGAQGQGLVQPPWRPSTGAKTAVGHASLKLPGRRQGAYQGAFEPSNWVEVWDPYNEDRQGYYSGTSHPASAGYPRSQYTIDYALPSQYSRQETGPRDFFALLSSKIKSKLGELLLLIAEDEQKIEG